MQGTFGSAPQESGWFSWPLHETRPYDDFSMVLRRSTDAWVRSAADGADWDLADPNSKNAGSRRQIKEQYPCQQRHPQPRTPGRSG